ncbi:hypothetical protein TNCV_3181131, partial [Trichonephila clavipes]
MANNQSVRRHLDALPVESLGEVGGRRQCDKCDCIVQVLLTTFHEFGDNFKLQEQLSGGSVVVVHEEPHPQIPVHCLTGQKKQAE